MPIKSVFARQIYDSTGYPTVEVDLITDLGLFRAAVPSALKTTEDEAFELRDEEATHYHGMGVLKAVNHVNEILGPELVKRGYEVIQQEAIDNFLTELDGTENKSKYGVNAILGISLAVAKAGAAKRGLPLYKHLGNLAGNKDVFLPVPLFSVINGGTRSASKLAIQEFLILPTGAQNFAEAMKMGCEVYHTLKNLVKDKYGVEAIVCVGDEGGFSPKIANNKDALTILNNAISKAGYTGRMEIGLNVAAGEFFKTGKYDVDFKNPKSDKSKWLTPEKFLQQHLDLLKTYPIVTIEDPFHNDNIDLWAKMTKDTSIQIIGNKLTSTNPKKIQEAIDKQACNCILLNLNQIGTLSEAIKAHLLAKANGWGTLLGSRLGETEDNFIADLAVGLSIGQIKTGAPCRAERLAKYNQILRIEEEMGSKAKYAGRAFRRPN